MHHLPRLANRLFNRPLLATPHYAQVIASVLAPRVGIQAPLSPAEYGVTERPERLPMLTQAGVYVLPVTGGLIHRGDRVDAMSGLTAYTYLENELKAALDSREVKAILLDIDSPGGEAGGAFELADSILTARKIKPIWAIANTLACSGAYLVGCSAERFFATVSAQVGSIGVVTMHVDMSGALEKRGLVTTLIYAGRHKVDGNPYEPLPDDVRADIQASVDQTYRLFVEQVAARRPLTADQVRATEARVYHAEAAVELGLVDRVASFQAVLAELEAEVQPALVQGASPSARGLLMTTQTTESPAPAQAQVESLSAAERQRIEEEAFTRGYVQGRADAADILLSAEAEGREKAAAQIARNAKIGKQEAIELLTSLPKEEATKQGGFLNRLMSQPGNNPQVTAGGGETDPQEERRKQLRQTMQAVNLKYRRQ